MELKERRVICPAQPKFAQPDPYLQPTAYAAHARERDAISRSRYTPVQNDGSMTAWPNAFERGAGQPE